MENKENERPIVIPDDIISNLPRKEAVVLTKIFNTGSKKGYSKVSDEFLSSIIKGSTPEEINDIIDDLSRKNTLSRYFDDNNYRILLINPDVFNIYKNTRFYKNAADQTIPNGYKSIEKRNKNFDGLVVPSGIKLSIDYRYIPLLAIIVANSKKDGYIKMDKLAIIANQFNISDFKLTLGELSANVAINCYVKEGEVAIISPSLWTRSIYDQCGVHLPELKIPQGFKLFTNNIKSASTPTIPKSNHLHFNDDLRIPIEIQNEINYKYWVPFIQFIRTTEKTGTGYLGAITKLLHGSTKEDEVEMFKYLYEKEYVNIYFKFFNDSNSYSFSIVLGDKVDSIYSNYYDLYVHKPKLNNTSYEQIDLPTFLKESKGE